MCPSCIRSHLQLHRIHLRWICVSDLLEGACRGCKRAPDGEEKKSGRLQSDSLEAKLQNQRMLAGLHRKNAHRVSQKLASEIKTYVDEVNVHGALRAGTDMLCVDGKNARKPNLKV